MTEISNRFASGQKNQGQPIFTTSEVVLDQPVPSQWNATGRDYPRDMTLCELFEAQVDRTPEAVAVVLEDEELTFRELDKRSNALAQHLRSLGVGCGKLVVISAERSLEMIVGLLGIVKAGGTYVPVDPKYPASRIQMVLEDALPMAIVADKVGSLAVSKLVAGVAMVALDDAKSWRNDIADSFSEQLSPCDLAYVLYTSGSTGSPKGVSITHRSLVNYMVWQIGEFALTASDCFLQQTSIGFDPSGWEIWIPLLLGGKIVLLPPHLHADPSGITRTVTRHGVTVVGFVPSLLRLVVEETEPPLSCDWIFVGGEAIDAKLVSRAKASARRGVVNLYGPTEATICSTSWTSRLEDEVPAVVPIGRPIANTQAYVMDADGRLLRVGEIGELHLGGDGLAAGYFNRPELTAEKFVVNPFGQGRLYRTGDLARWLPDGTIECLGRVDQQVKIRGFRIELGDVEAALRSHDAVREAAVVALPDGPDNKKLVAYVVGCNQVDTAELRAHLGEVLPAFMIPSAIVLLDGLPLMPNGKLDRSALPAPSRKRTQSTGSFVAASGKTEEALSAVFQQVLGLEELPSINDNFFELGGSSVTAVLAANMARSLHSLKIPIFQFFQYPTIAALARYLGEKTPQIQQRTYVTASSEQEPIAIVGMAVRFPGAKDVETFWSNLLNGVESVRYFSPEELDPQLPKSLTSDPRYVPARGVLDDIDMFDAAYFGIAPFEAELIDPQQRLMLELCVHALENAGHASHTFSPNETVGIFAGTSNNTYYLNNVRNNASALDRAGDMNAILANEKDYVTTRVAHRLALTGPAVSIHTACSTSLVATTQAFYALRSQQCDFALAGGVALTVPTNRGHLHQEGSALSSDGHTRPFSERASGTTFSDGGGVVVLRRLADAQRDGDTIYAVIKGAAINNDGGDRASFTAPSVSGQAAVIVAAQAVAKVDARSIGYVEAHGTATPLGDPIELEALRQAFLASTSDLQFCGIGSIKSNFGHATVAAGVAGLVKTTLALRNEVIPKTLHYVAPNPAIDFANTPFFVDAKNRDWKRCSAPRLAGVSSFGFGGTNAHLVLEEAPPDLRIPHLNSEELLVFSARSKTSLSQHTTQVRQYLQSTTAPALEDAAFTLQLGRRAFVERRFAVVGCRGDLAEEKLFFSQTAASRARGVAFMFPGQGVQYVGMGRSLYQREPIFRAIFDEANSIISAKLGQSLKDVMFAQPSGAAEKALQNTAFTQSALFTLQYSLASLWMHWGIQPVAMIGHSIGEFAAAAIAGVFSLEDALALVAERGLLMQAQPSGTMLSVRLAADKVKSRLVPSLSLATVNSPDLCVVAGPTPDVLTFQQALESDGVLAKVLVTSHAFHSPMMEPAVAPFLDVVKGIKLQAPRFRIMSTARADWLSDEVAQDPSYWARHMRDTVRFSDGMFALLKDTPGVSLLEVGPRTTLGTLARQHIARKKGNVLDAAPDDRLVVSSLSDEPDQETRSLLAALGQLWASGETVDWRAFQGLQGQAGVPPRRRVALPGYVFERKSFWISPSTLASDQPNPLASEKLPALSTDLKGPAVTAALPASLPVSLNIPASFAEEDPVVSDRKSELIASLTTLIEDTSGLDLTGTDPNATFFELGIDSLLLTQIAQGVTRQFKVNVTFRQLSESFLSVALLADHLDSKLPRPAASGAVATKATPAIPQPSLALFPTVAVAEASRAGDGFNKGSSFAEALIAEQLRVMQQQLALLSGGNWASTQAGPVPTPIAVPATPTASNPATAPTNATLLPSCSPSNDEDLAHTRYDVKKAFGAIARIHTQNKDLTERQKIRLDAFIRRYSERTAKSKAFTDANRSHMADPRVVNGFRPALKEITYQIVVERSKGAYLWDIDGNQYVDVLNGFGMNMFGWQPDFVQEAVRQQLDSGYEIGPQHPLAAEVTKLLCELTGFDRAGLCNTGSEAVMAAMRIARTVTGRNTIVTFTGDYHGTFDEVLVRAGRHAQGLSAAPGVMSGMFGDIRVLNYGSPAALAFIRANVQDIAAVLVEPVQSRRPEFQPQEFLKELRGITEASDVCLIFDEVITGFRSHLGGAQAVFGVRADLATYGKVIGGGFPVGAVAGTRKYMDALDGGAWKFGDDSIPSVGVTYFAGTFVRHPLALAACKASMEFLKKDNGALQVQLSQRTAALANELTAYCRSVGAPVEVRHFASLWRVAWLEDHPYQDLLFAMMRSRGVHILDNFPCFMTMAHTEDDILLVVKVFKDSVDELQEAGFLPAAKQVPQSFDANKPPVPGARLGRDPSGVAAWFVPNPREPGKYIKVVQTA